MDTLDLTRIVRELGATAAPPRCECQHDPGSVQCPDGAVFAVTIVCSEPGCDCAAGVFLLCDKCWASWRRRAAEPGAPELRARRL